MSTNGFLGGAAPFDDVPLQGDFRDMAEQMIARLRDDIAREELLEQAEDAEMAKADEERAERARSGELGPEWRAVQARIDLGQSSLEAVFSGDDDSPAAESLRNLSKQRLSELREQWEADSEDPDKGAPPAPADIFDKTLQESQERFAAAAERIRDALANAERRTEDGS